MLLSEGVVSRLGGGLGRTLVVHIFVDKDDLTAYLKAAGIDNASEKVTEFVAGVNGAKGFMMMDTGYAAGMVLREYW